MDEKERYEIMYNENHDYDNLKEYDWCKECEAEATRFDVFVMVNGKEECFHVCYECGQELEVRWS